LCAARAPQSEPLRIDVEALQVRKQTRCHGRRRFTRGGYGRDPLVLELELREHAPGATQVVHRLAEPRERIGVARRGEVVSQEIDERALEIGTVGTLEL